MEIKIDKIILTKLLIIASYTLMWKFLVIPKIAITFGLLGFILNFVNAKIAVGVDKKEFVLKFIKSSPVFLGLTILQILVITFNLSLMSGFIYVVAWIVLLQDYLLALGCFILAITYYVLKIKNIVDLVDDGDIFK